MPVFPLVAAGSKSGRADRAELEMCSAPSSLYAIGSVELELQHVHCTMCETALGWEHARE